MSLAQHVRGWTGGIGVWRKLAVALAAAALASGIATYLAMSGAPPFGPPTTIVAVFSYLFFSCGLESCFSDKVRTAISESVAVAAAYVREHQQAIRADALAMANDLDRSASTLQLNPQYLAPMLTAQA